MEDWVWWLVAALALAAGEVMTTSFFLAPFAGGAAAAALLAAAGVGFVAAGLVFVVVSGVLLLALRPVARRHLRQPARLRTGTAALVGTTAVVLDRIDNAGNAGSVRLAGEVWTARAFDDEEVIEPGRRVQVIEIRGATALVTE